MVLYYCLDCISLLATGSSWSILVDQLSVSSGGLVGSFFHLSVKITQNPLGIQQRRANGFPFFLLLPWHGMLPSIFLVYTAIHAFNLPPKPYVHFSPDSL